jgi:redox-sensing transcriptional repressor
MRKERMTKARKIPKATITRLSMYYRQLELLEFDGYRMVSSEKLAWLCQINPAQVRKDLGYFGEFGVRGVGYDVIDLQTQIKKILSLNRDWHFGIAGMGNMGCAIFLHRNLALRGFKCVAAFDNSQARIGMPLPGGMGIQNIGELKKTIRDRNIEIGVITTPPSAAQEVADLFMEGHVNAILNFAPTRIKAPDCCLVENMDFTVIMDVLAYNLHQKMAA